VSSAMTVALYPGSFDPVHNGHLAMIRQAAVLFDRVIVGVGHNPQKPSGRFRPDERVSLIEAEIPDLGNVEVALFSGLVTVAARDLGADCLVKGIRGAADLDAELQQAHMNLSTGGMPTVFLPAASDAAFVASRYVREIAAMGGDVRAVVPPAVADRLQEDHRR
jgi:pantetheine-phosphate adenylyltransferase